MMMISPLVYAQSDKGLFSAATEIGADTGAMEYCEKNFADKDDEGKYKLVRLQALNDFDALEEEAKAKALVVRVAARDNGDYLGKKLTKKRCEDLRKLFNVKYLGTNKK